MESIEKIEITVFIALFNSENYISDTIKSVLNQTFTNYEILIINDASTDNSVAIVENFNSKRIRLVHNSENKGICFTRQRGVEEAKGKYIAILDADDIAEKNRLQIQYDFLEQNQEFAVCGTNTKFIDENSKPLQDEFIVNTNYDEIKLKLLFANQFINSSVLIRKSAIEEIGGYKRHTAEDYDLFVRLAEKFKVVNLDQYLVTYRIHNNGDSKIRQNKYIEAEKEILKYQYQKLGIDDMLNYIPYLIFTHNFNEIKINDLNLFFEKILKNNKEKQLYDVALFNKTFLDLWIKIVTSRKNHKQALKLVLNENFNFSDLTLKQKRRLIKLLINPFRWMKLNQEN